MDVGEPWGIEEEDIKSGKKKTRILGSGLKNRE